jgi:uncharacterized protein
LRFLTRLSSSGPGRSEFLQSTRAFARAVGADVRNPKWTSEGSLEIDVFVPTANDFQLFISALGPLYHVEFVHDLNVAPPHMEEDELVAEARNYFNSERFWECHETLEGLWKVKGVDEKRFLQGVILVCAAFVHHQKGEEEVAMGVLRRASAQLEFSQENYHGIDVGQLKARVSRILEDAAFTPFSI